MCTVLFQRGVQPQVLPLITLRPSSPSFPTLHLPDEGPRREAERKAVGGAFRCICEHAHSYTRDTVPTEGLSPSAEGHFLRARSSRWRRKSRLRQSSQRHELDEQVRSLLETPRAQPRKRHSSRGVYRGAKACRSQSVRLTADSDELPEEGGVNEI